MHIKQVVLAGFKSYRDEVVVRDFSPGLNVIVGKNGTGKSNIFNAIRYVLDPKDESSIRNSQAPRGQDCFVEITFDNSDKRFLTLDDEVRIKRSVDARNDYWVNDRKTPQKDVFNYLESAGFGSSNPFYIVPQGKVTQLINASDSERLNQLMVASGLTLFERKKTEAEASLKKSLQQIEATDKLLADMNEKLEALQQEVETSEEFDKTSLLVKKLNREQLAREESIVNEKLQQCSEAVQQLRQRQSELVAKIGEAENGKRTVTNEISDLKCKIDTLNAQIEFNEQESDTETVQPYQDLAADIETKLAKNLDLLQAATEEAEATQAKLSSLSSELEAMMIRQAAASKFTSLEERNQWLDARVSQGESDLKTMQESLATIQDEINSINMPMIADEQDRVERLTATLEEQKSAVHRTQKKVAEYQEQLRVLQLENRKSEIIVENIDEQITSAQQSTNDAMLADIVTTIEQARAIAKSLGLENKFYGPVANLMSIDEMFAPAAEAIAKSALFYCVAEDSATVKAIAAEMVRLKGHQLSFIPLDQINPKPRIEVGAENADVASPLTDQIECDAKFQAAVDLVIGNALICSDLESSWRCSRVYNVECVTLDGHLVNPHGALRGGSKSRKVTSRFAAIKEITSLHHRKVAAQAQIVECNASIDRQRQQITAGHNDLTTAKADVARTFAELDSARRSLSDAQQRVFEAEQSRGTKQQQAQLVTDNIENLKAQTEQYRADLRSEFSGPLNSSEMLQLNALDARCKELAAIKAKSEQQMAHLEKSVEVLRSQNWDASMQRERELLSATEAEEPNDDLRDAMAKAVRERDACVESFETKRDQLRELSDELSVSLSKVEQLKREISKQEFRDEKFKELLSDNLLEQRKLGSITDTGEFSALEDAQLETQLQDARSKLSRYGPINLFAGEQFSKYTEEYQQHEEYKRKLVTEIDESKSMIEAYDEYKSQAILKTYRSVQREFSAIFRRLTQIDSAELRVEGTDPLEWEGIEVTVSFARHRQLRIEQLSGGQKALCALAFLMALQASDPAPFYIFDEVDASLDSQYRGSLADTLRQIASHLGSQFICTTFGPELVRASDKVYGTAFAGDSSRVDGIDVDTAISLVDASETV